MVVERGSMVDGRRLFRGYHVETDAVGELIDWSRAILKPCS
jgi:hypothetical protein